MQGSAKRSIHVMFTKAQLISFGNSLLKTYGIRFHSSDGHNTPMEQCEVTDADFLNWRENQISDRLLLPSRFNFGDRVVVSFGKFGTINNCKVIKIHFTESKVFYDVEVKWESLDGKENYTDRLYNLDSCVVHSPEDFQ